MTAVFGGIAGLGLVLLALGGLAYYLGVFSTIRAVLVLIGIILLGVSAGHLLGWIAIVVGWINSGIMFLTSWLFGAAVPGLLAIILAGILVFDLAPRNRAGKRTFFIAIALGVMIATASTHVDFLNQLGPSVQHGVSQVGG
jgi:hypothetical protein